MGRDLWSRIVRTGLTGGAAILYVCAVGMVGDFSTRNLVSTEVTLGKVLLWIPMVAAGYAAARPRRRAEGPVPLGGVEAVAAGLVAGLAGGLLVAAGIGVVVLIGRDVVRNVLISVSEPLLRVLAFHRGTLQGSILFVISFAVLAGIGAALRLLPPVARRPLVTGLVTIVAMGLLQRIVPTILSELKFRSSWLYDPIYGGLTRQGAALSFALGAAGVWLGDDLRRRRLRRELTPSTDAEGFDPFAFGSRARLSKVVALVVVAAALIELPRVAGSIVSDTLGFVGIFLLLALGLNIIVGNAGLLHLGFVVFFAIGAYATAILVGGRPVTALGLAPTVLPFHVSFYVAIPIVLVVAALIGVLMAAPTVRLSGDYLAIVTLGFGAIALVLVQSDWTKGFTGGAQGFTSIPPAPILGFDAGTPQRFYYLALVACALCVFVSYRLTSSRIGRAWNAMREDEQVAEAMGISVVRYKLLASAVGGAMGALGGALFAVKLGSLTSQDFTILASITALAIIILGGLASIRGAILGAFVLVGLPNLLSEFEQYRLAIYGASLIAIMLYRPQGLLPNVRLARELQEEDRAQDLWLRELGTAGATVSADGAAPGDGEDRP